MYRLNILILLLTMIFIPTNAIDLSSLLPKQGNEWLMSDSDQYFNTETLYNYIDGGAELYLSYGFTNVLSRRYSCPGEMDIVAEIFDMKQPRDAFGAFSNMREKNQHEFGQGSQQLQGSLIFWKDHYFITLSTNKSTEKSMTAIRKIAAYIDQAILQEGKIPAVFDYLPKENRVPEGYCSFHHYIWLNAYYFIANYNILNVNDSTDAVIAKYGPPEKRVYLLLIRYPDVSSAKAAYDKFTGDFSPELKNTEAIKLKDKSWHTASLQGSLFISIFNAATKEEALKLLHAVKTDQ